MSHRLTPKNILPMRFGLSQQNMYSVEESLMDISSGRAAPVYHYSYINAIARLRQLSQLPIPVDNTRY